MAEKSADGGTQGPLPVVEFLKIPETGDPYLEGHKCKKCSAVFPGERSICSKCGDHSGLEPFRLSNQGKLYVWSIVYRSFPGIDVPYVSAIVDLDGGGTVKGNLINVEPDPEKIEFGMPVEMVFEHRFGWVADQDDLVQARRQRLLDAVLDDRLVEDRQELLRKDGGCRQDPGPETRGRKDGLADGLRRRHRAA